MASTLSLKRLCQRKTVLSSTPKPCTISKANVYMGKAPRTPIAFNQTHIMNAPSSIGVHVATALSDTQVLAINKQSSLIYDVENNSWTELPIKLQSKTFGSKLESLHHYNGKAFIFTSNESLLIDLKTNSVDKIEPCPLNNYVSARIGDDVLAMGTSRKDDLFNRRMTVWRYKLDQGGNGNWTEIEVDNMSVVPRHFSMATVVDKTKIFAYFSSFLETAYIMEQRILDISSGKPTWIIPNVKHELKPKNRANMSVCTFVDSLTKKPKILSTGGNYELGGGLGGYLNDVDIFDPTSLEYEGIPRFFGKPFVDVRVFHSLTPLGENGILVLGGHDQFGPLSTGARFQQNTNAL